MKQPMESITAPNASNDADASVCRHSGSIGRQGDASVSVPSTAVSRAFELFLREAPAHAQAWMVAIEVLAKASALETKTSHLAYLSVLAALRLESGVPFHVLLAKQAGASRAEVVSAILIGLPAAGNVVIQCLPAALAAYDSI